MAVPKKLCEMKSGTGPGAGAMFKPPISNAVGKLLYSPTSKFAVIVIPQKQSDFVYGKAWTAHIFSHSSNVF